MTGYLYRSEWSERHERWLEKQLVSPEKITVKNIEEIFDILDVQYGRFESCVSTYATTQFLLINEKGGLIDYINVREKLPWEE